MLKLNMNVFLNKNLINKCFSTIVPDASFVMDKVAATVAKKLKVTNWGSWWHNKQNIDVNSMSKGNGNTIADNRINVRGLNKIMLCAVFFNNLKNSGLDFIKYNFNAYYCSTLLAYLLKGQWVTESYMNLFHMFTFPKFIKRWVFYTNHKDIGTSYYKNLTQPVWSSFFILTPESAGFVSGVMFVVVFTIFYYSYKKTFANFLELYDARYLYKVNTNYFNLGNNPFFFLFCFIFLINSLILGFIHLVYDYQSLYVLPLTKPQAFLFNSFWLLIGCCFLVSLLITIYALIYFFEPAKKEFRLDFKRDFFNYLANFVTIEGKQNYWSYILYKILPVIILFVMLFYYITVLYYPYYFLYNFFDFVQLSTNNIMSNLKMPHALRYCSFFLYFMVCMASLFSYGELEQLLAEQQKNNNTFGLPLGTFVFLINRQQLCNFLGFSIYIIIFVDIMQIPCNLKVVFYFNVMLFIVLAMQMIFVGPYILYSSYNVFFIKPFCDVIFCFSFECFYYFLAWVTKILLKLNSFTLIHLYCLVICYVFKLYEYLWLLRSYSNIYLSFELLIFFIINFLFLIFLIGKEINNMEYN